ncbi:TetR/AcrR family transcriptional regulator [Sunxiuqinia sp. sy24]|uniref:TetR/AcrR family transcriptional regulator n=1 Tax=Sunxiuqinia sp. sy24 TaxID=3461495 RepID=UPI004046143A
MPRNTEQLEQLRKEKKEHIQQIALELFAENGFHGTSISQITKKANISKGLIYNYFKSKEDILEDIIRTGHESIYADFDFNQNHQMETDDFVLFIRKSIRTTIENAHFWKLYYALMLNPHIHQKYVQQFAGNSQSVMQALRDFLTHEGSTDPDQDLFKISALLKGALLMVVVSPEFFKVKELEDTLIQSAFKLISQKE